MKINFKISSSFLFAFTLSLLVTGCRSGHFEKDNTNENQASFRTSLATSRLVTGCADTTTSTESKCFRSEWVVDVSTLQDEPILNHPFDVTLKHDRLISTATQKVKTDDRGRLTFQADFQSDPEDDNASYDVGIKIQSDHFGSQFFSSPLQKSRAEGPVMGLKESVERNFHPSVVAKPAELAVQAVKVITLRSEPKENFRRLNTLRAVFRFTNGQNGPTLGNREMSYEIKSSLSKYGVDLSGKKKTSSDGTMELDFTLLDFPTEHQTHIQLESHFERDSLTTPRYLLLDFENHPGEPLIDSQSTPYPADQLTVRQVQKLSLTSVEWIPQLAKQVWSINSDLELGFSPMRFELRFQPKLSRLTFRQEEWVSLPYAHITGKLLFVDPNESNPNKAVFYEEKLDESASETSVVKHIFQPSWKSRPKSLDQFLVVLMIHLTGFDTLTSYFVFDPSRQTIETLTQEKTEQLVGKERLLEDSLLKKDASATTRNVVEKQASGFENAIRLSKSARANIPTEQTEQDTIAALIRQANPETNYEMLWKKIAIYIARINDSQAAGAEDLLTVEQADIIQTISNQSQKRLLGPESTVDIEGKKFRVEDVLLNFDTTVIPCFIFKFEKTEPPELHKKYFECLDLSTNLKNATQRWQYLTPLDDSSEPPALIHGNTIPKTLTVLTTENIYNHPKQKLLLKKHIYGKN